MLNQKGLKDKQYTTTTLPKTKTLNLMKQVRNKICQTTLKNFLNIIDFF